MAGEQNKEFWLKKARKLSLRINLAWWLQSLIPALFLISLIATCFILLARRNGEITGFTWLGIGVAFVLTVIFSWWKASRHFTNLEHSLVRLEGEMKLCNALSTAQQGLREWPEPKPELKDGLQWNWKTLTLPLLASMAFFSMAFLLPVGKASLIDDEVMAPRAWQELQADIEQLKEDEVVQEDYLEELQERLDHLNAQDKDEWFSHSSLEATDSLKDSHRNEVARLQRDLVKTMHSLEQMATAKEEQADREAMMGQLQTALSALEDGAMKPNAELLEKLKKIGEEGIKQLPPEQLKELQKKLKENAQKLAQARQKAGEKGDWLDRLMAENEKGNGDEDGNDEDQKGPG